MEKLLLFISAAAGLCAVSSNAERRFHFVYERKNWTEALSYCREKYTDLAYIHDMNDVNVLKSTANTSKMDNSEEYKYRVWIGLYDDVNSWRWSMTDKDFHKCNETMFINWRDLEPNNLRGIEQCVHVYTDGKWNDEDCHVSFKAICFDNTGPNVSYVLTNNAMTWTEAQSYCRTHHTDLASVRNMTENQRVAAVVPSGTKVWIGLFRDSWKWTDGHNFSFNYWKNSTNEPNNYFTNETCAAADFSDAGQWEDWPCHYKRPFICYSDKTPTHFLVVKVKLVKPSSVDLSDPAVMEDLLQQMKQRLKDQGLKGDVKLSWRKQLDGTVFHKEEEGTK
ncbi:putative C-type lectin domain family 20 member A [Mugil cephalus]|uniref:putative C-type lectin domain family 20 member A n=1 Tax=Mugil cephalus TaxID=48193 RepID=UPI001FB77A00|nr:putative C-type lectin domain family 20 member A [Mugil cephalus]